MTPLLTFGILNYPCKDTEKPSALITVSRVYLASLHCLIYVFMDLPSLGGRWLVSQWTVVVSSVNALLARKAQCPFHVSTMVDRYLPASPNSVICTERSLSYSFKIKFPDTYEWFQSLAAIYMVATLAKCIKKKSVLGIMAAEQFSFHGRAFCCCIAEWITELMGACKAIASVPTGAQL